MACTSLSCFPWSGRARLLNPHGLADALREAGHVQLTGPSGAGNTHLVRHMLPGLDDDCFRSWSGAARAGGGHPPMPSRA